MTAARICRVCRVEGMIGTGRRMSWVKSSCRDRSIAPDPSMRDANAPTRTDGRVPNAPCANASSLIEAPPSTLDMRRNFLIVVNTRRARSLFF